MSTEIVFQTHLVLGYVAWLLCFGAYIWPWRGSIDRIAAQRAIATLHSFRFFGLVFILPGVVSPDLPAEFATFAAYADFATGVSTGRARETMRSGPGPVRKSVTTSPADNSGDRAPAKPAATMR